MRSRKDNIDCQIACNFNLTIIGHQQHPISTTNVEMRVNKQKYAKRILNKYISNSYLNKIGR